MHESAALSHPCLCVYGIWPRGACILQMLVNVCHAISGLLSCRVLPQGFVRILQMLVTVCHAIFGLLSYDLVAMFLWQLECYPMILLQCFYGNLSAP